MALHAFDSIDEVVVRPVATDEELDAYVALWNAVTPDEPTSTYDQRSRRERDPRRLYLLAEIEGRQVGCGFAGPSDSPSRGFVQPRVLEAERRRGIGTLILQALLEHARGLGFQSASSHVDGNDAAALAFARCHGFDEVDRQVEQVKRVGDEPPGEPPEGIVFVTIAERPELLEAAHELAVEGYADMATSTPVTISLQDWLAEEASLPAGSFVALAGDEIIGFSGLCRRHDGVVEDGLTVVRRAWRRRGLAEALKRAELAWAASNGVEEIITWTQKGNEGMRALNELLGYEYRSVSVTVRAPLDAQAL